jgi:hypothetical protein
MAHPASLLCLFCPGYSPPSCDRRRLRRTTTHQANEPCPATAPTRSQWKKENTTGMIDDTSRSRSAAAYLSKISSFNPSSRTQYRLDRRSLAFRLSALCKSFGSWALMLFFFFTLQLSLTYGALRQRCLSDVWHAAEEACQNTMIALPT